MKTNHLFLLFILAGFLACERPEQPAGPEENEKPVEQPKQREEAIPFHFDRENKLSARTGEGREGESLYKDQQFTVGEASFLVY